MDEAREFLRSLPRPEPSAGLQAYEDELQAALALSPRKRANYEAYQRSRRRSAEVDYLPIKLDIENVSRCNFACTMCAVSKWPKGQRAHDMDLSQFESIIDEQYGLVEIKLNGLGEALMQGDPYFEMIRYARSKRIWVRMTTNASLLHLNENYKKLIASGVNEIDISVDGPDEDSYEAIRRQGKFERVVQNCKLLNDHAASLGLRRTKLWTLVQEGNYQRLPEMVELAAKMGFAHYVLSLNLHGWGDPELERRNRSVAVADRLEPDELLALVKQGEAIGIKVSFWNVADKFETGAPESLCPWPFERAVITSDSRTVPCCMIGDPDAFEVGRGSGKGFSQLWQGSEYGAFRQAHIDGAIPAVCKSCYRCE